MPSAGVLPFLQSFFCTFNNTCHETVTQDEEPGNVGNFGKSILTNLVFDIEEILNSNIDRELISDLLEDWEIITQLMNKISSGSTTGAIRIGTVLGNPQNISDVVKEKKINLSLDVLINVMNATLDFNQLNKPSLNKIFKDFDTCPDSQHRQPAALEIWQRICDTGSVLHTIDFHSDEAKERSQREICDLDKADLEHMYQAFRAQFSIQRFFIQMFKFIFLNTKKIPNVQDIYKRFKKLIGDLTSLKELDIKKMEKFFRDMNKKKINSTLIVQNLGDFVCGANSFLRVQSKRSEDLFERFRSHGRLSRGESDGSTTTNDYGKDRPLCRDLVNFLNEDVQTQILWKNLRPVVLGRITYAPDTPSVRKIIEKANQTFSDFARAVQLAKDWEGYIESVQNHFAGSSTYDILRRFSGSCLCDLVENITMSAFGKTKTVGICRFTKTLLSGNPDIGNYNWRDIIKFTKSLARVLADYGECMVFDKFVGFATEEEMLTESTKMVENNTLWGALVFDINNETHKYSLPTHVSYKIRMDADRVDTTDRVLDQVYKPGPRRTPGKETKFLTYGFAYLQDMVEHAIIKVQTGSDKDVGVMVEQFPYPCYIRDSFTYAIEIVLPLLLVLAWILPVAMLCKNIVYEKEKRLKEVMRMMGLGNGVHWLAWFINAFVVMMFTMGLLVILLKFGKVIQHTDPTVLLFFFSTFALATIMQCFFFSVLFHQANLAACSAGFLYFTLYIPYVLAKRWQEVLHLPEKMAICLSSSIAFGFGCFKISQFEQQAVGVQWHNIWDSPMTGDDFSMMHIIIMMFVDTVLYGLLTWYIEAVFPGEYGIPRPWYFFVLKSYWCGNQTKEGNLEEGLSPYFDSEGKPVEDEPQDKTLGVGIRGLKKVYTEGNKVAVNGLSLNFYEGQITSFLGHNGAGKTTTMSILTGMFPPTDGTAYIYGKDIRKDMDEIRQSLGVCPQHDLLFQFMTVREHLWFYSQLKGLSLQETANEINPMIKDVGLSHRKHAFPHMLSGGMKRKLSVAIAFVGHVKTVILDEPTAGVDPYSRRSIWELLLKYKEGRTIILSTHHMDEADVLGDRIAIISQGKLCCCGSSLFLKSQYGNGYYLTIVRNLSEDHTEVKGDKCGNDQMSPLPLRKSPIPAPRRKANQKGGDETEAIHHSISCVEKLKKEEGTCHSVCGAGTTGATVITDEFLQFTRKRLLAFVKKFVKKAKFVEDNSTEVTFLLPEASAHNGDFEDLFMELERSRKKLGISSFGVSDTSLEEVFLKVAEEDGEKQTDEVKRNKLEENTDRGRVPRPVTNLSFRHNRKASYLRSQSVEEKNNKINLEEGSADGFNHELQERVQGKKLLFMQFYALLIKRFHHFKRSKKGFLCEIVMPVLFILISMVFAKIESPFAEPQPMTLHPWHFTPKRNDPHLYMFYSLDENSRLGNNLVRTLKSDYGIGNRCLDPEVYTLQEYPCRPQYAAIYITDTSSNQTQDCSCSTGVQYCPKGAVGPEPPLQMLASTDYLYDLTDRNISDWLLKTNDQFIGKRFGGFSFGEKTKLAKLNNKNVHELLQKFSSVKTSDKSYGIDNNKIWSNVALLLNTMATEDIAKVWYNNKGYIAVVSYMNVVNNVILRSKLPRNKDPSQYGITVINHPLQLSQQQSQQESKFNSKADVLVATCVIFAMSFIPASFVMILIEERISNSKHLQFVSGVNPAIYWSTNFLWDMLNYSISCVLCVCIFLGFQVEAYVSPTNLPCLILLLIMFGYALIPMMYPFSRVFNVASTAMVTLKSINIFIGTTSTLSTFILELLAEEDEQLQYINELLKNVMLIFPQYCLGLGLMEMSRNQLYSDAFKKFNMKSRVSPLQFDMVGKNILALFLQGTLFFFLNLLIEYNFCLKPRQITMKDYPYGEDDLDVEKERRRVLEGGAAEDVVRVENMTKIYRMAEGKSKHTAVDRLCVGISRGQCFGLLGVNGAGKTTTFKMLTGDIPISSGAAYIAGHSVIDEIDTVRKSVGYCPQFDAYDFLLTSKEVLIFYARLRGIPEKDVNKVADWGIKKLGLIPYANKLSGGYSGGNKRKLSTAIALLGNPKVIFLDEPTTGMDPKARRFLWTCINSIVKDGRSIILTSHSMEECEALCGRLAIMVNGKFRCIGSIQHLKNRFGDGYTILIRVSGANPNLEPVERYINTMFPGSTLKEKHHNMLQYQLGPTIKLSYIFGQIESVRHEFSIEDYSVSQTTLDQVFINFAKNQTDVLPEEENIPDTTQATGENVHSLETQYLQSLRVSQTGSTIHLIGSEADDPIYVNTAFVSELEETDV
ncbi:phospholipid-transporting ATPase ABCA1-like [Saccostrea cucullata]|uniref:phospholipid-transporting ATPase ABCA1-like n=1 Tax=Saccostrea cuccullata TaxID=36930 RepID=UPI002ED422ED